MTVEELEAVGLRVKPRAWSEQTPPNAECPYDHVLSEPGPFRYRITWKGWKNDNAHHCELDELGGWVGCEYGLVDAKAACEAHHAARIAGELEPLPEGTEK